jgi:hypothetical protein
MEVTMQMRILKNRVLKAGILMVAVLLFAVSCEDTTTRPRDHTPPPVPSGLTSFTGDNVIWLEWDPIIGVSDLDGYSIYRSTDNSLFYWLDDVNDDVIEYADYDVVNGETYYYGVSSFDFNGNESDVSFDYVVVFDTPRPQGSDVILYSFTEGPYINLSGFDFSAEERVPYDFFRSDIFLEYDGTPGITTYFVHLGPNGSGIQDMGYTESLFDITYAPLYGWSDLNYAEAIAGHTYIVRTLDDHYAMIRIIGFDDLPARHMVFDWAYQIDQGNRELKIGAPSVVILRPDRANNAD